MIALWTQGINSKDGKKKNKTCISIQVLLLVFPIKLGYSQESDQNSPIDGLQALQCPFILTPFSTIFIIYSLQLHGFFDNLTCQQRCCISTFALAVLFVSSRKLTVKTIKYWNSAAVFPSPLPLLIPTTLYNLLISQYYIIVISYFSFFLREG